MGRCDQQMFPMPLFYALRYLITIQQFNVSLFLWLLLVVVVVVLFACFCVQHTFIDLYVNLFYSAF